MTATKKTIASVPDELKDEEFTFRIKAAVGKYKNNTVEYENEAFTGVYYSLWQRDGIISESAYNGLTAKEKEESYTILSSHTSEQYALRWKQIEQSIPHSTDSTGAFKLKNDQRAVFSYISSTTYNKDSVNAEFLNQFEIDAYNIEEEAKPYWHVEKEINVDNEKTGVDGAAYRESTVSFTNNFRPVIYVSKKTSYVPDSVKNIEPFDFLLRIKKNDGSNHYLTKEEVTDDNFLKIINKVNRSKTDSTPTSTSTELYNIYEDGKLYVYNTGNAARKYGSPKNWYPWFTEKGLYYYDESNITNSITQSAIEPKTIRELYNNDNTKKYVQYMTNGELGSGITSEENMQGSTDNTAYFAFSIKSGETVGIPVYFKGGMLDSTDNPKYTYEIMEVSAEYLKQDGKNENDEPKYKAVGNEHSEWLLLNQTYSNTIEGAMSEEISEKFENVYKYKEIALTKEVKFPDDDLLEETAFRFKISREAGEKTPEDSAKDKIWDTGEAITWKLVDEDGNPYTENDGENIIKYQGNVSLVDVPATNTTPATQYGEFVVPKAGKAGLKIVLDHIQADYDYTITEILDTPDANINSIAGSSYNSATGKVTIHLPIVNGDGELTGDYKPKDFTLATEKAYNATKITDSKMIPEKATTMPMPIVNVYKKRDLKVQKTVVAGTIDNNQEYSFTLKRRDGKAFDVDRSISSIQGVLVLNSKETEKNVQSYSFSLKADQVITFKQIGDMGDEFIVEETGTLPEGMQRLAGGDGITPIILPDITSYVTEEVINGDPNYVIVKKKYSGNGFDESSAQTILSNNLEMKLEFYKILDNTPISVSNIGNYVSLKTLTGISSVASETITMTGNDTIIINLKGIADSAKLSKEDIGYRVTETIPTASQKYIPVGEDVFYYIESAGDGDEHNTFSGTSADTVLNVNNTVTRRW